MCDFAYKDVGFKLRTKTEDIPNFVVEVPSVTIGLAARQGEGSSLGFCV